MQSFTRQELYDLVWSEPMRTIASRFSISDVGLAKACRKADIPLPPRGYWAKVQAGGSPQKIPLPPRGLGKSDTVALGGSRYASHFHENDGDLINVEISPPPEFPESIEAVTERVQKLVGKVTIPQDLTKAHHLIAGLLASDEARRRVQAQEKHLSFLHAPLFDAPFERRRLRLLNALFIALERAGSPPSFHGNDPSEFSVRVGDQHVSFKLDHPRAERRRWRSETDRTRPANEPLKLELSSWRMIEGVRCLWEDKGDDRVEKHVGEIVVTLIVAGEVLYRQGRLSHHSWLVEEKARLIEEARKAKEAAERAERERRIKKEKARIDRLLGEAAAFRQANDIRGYVQQVRNANETASEPVPAAELERWASWALAQADRIDPVLSRRFLQRDDQEDG